MATFDIIQRIESGKKPVPMLKKISEVSGLEVMVYRGPECVSIEQALTIVVNILKQELEKEEDNVSK